MENEKLIGPIIPPNLHRRLIVLQESLNLNAMAPGHKKNKPAFHPHPQRIIAAKKVQKKKLIANKRRNDELREHLDRQSNALPVHVLSIVSLYLIMAYTYSIQIHGISQPQSAPSTGTQADHSQSLLDLTAILQHL